MCPAHAMYIWVISRSDLPPGLNVHKIMAISNANLAIYHVRV
jgi:hypothetical protein